MVKGKIYRNNKEMIKAIKSSPRNSVIIFDDANLFPEELKQIEAENNKELVRMFNKMMKRARGLVNELQ